MDVLVIGIAGGTGSGKTTLMKSLMGQFGEEITVLSHDNYYRAHNDLPYEERCKLNYDEPAAFETELMVRHLEELRAPYAFRIMETFERDVNKKKTKGERGVNVLEPIGAKKESLTKLYDFDLMGRMNRRTSAAPGASGFWRCLSSWWNGMCMWCTGPWRKRRRPTYQL